jgi:hypothetical protein
MKSSFVALFGLALVPASCASEVDEFGSGRDAEVRAAKHALQSNTPGSPLLCAEDACTVPELGTNLDKLSSSETSFLDEACADGQNYCAGPGLGCYACCNNTWYKINQNCLYGLHFYCNGYHYNAYACWACCE